MTVLIKQTSSLQSIGKCGARVVCHGAQRHAVVCLDHTHLGECFLDGDGVDLAKEGIDERLAGNLDIAGALHVAVQIGAALIAVLMGNQIDYLSNPNIFSSDPYWHLGVLSIPISVLWIVAITNAVNLIDGLDGLACGVSTISSMTMLVIALTVAEAQVAILMAALAGACIGFLPYNLNPAKIFMGDTGSLFLGGAVCGLAFALDVPLVIPLVGLIYVLETLSDIIQVIYFKATHGKRFFRMAPLHHHLELGGWSETKLFCVFSGATLVLCVLAFLGVMNRYPM